VRRGGRHADLIAEREYRLTGPTADVAYLAGYRSDPKTWARALAELRRAMGDNPENELAWQGLAQEYAAAGSPALEQRLQALTRATTILADMRAAGRLHGERAESLLQLGRLDEAKIAGQNALRLDGNLPLPRYVLAGVAERRGAWAEARDQLRTLFASLEPGDPRAESIRERLEAAERSLQAEGSR